MAQKMKHIALAMLTLVLVMIMTPNATLAEQYRLGIGDSINVEMLLMENGEVAESKIVRLQAENARIGPDGRATVSIVGGVDAVGLTADELAEDISSLTANRLSVHVQPFITVSVATYRPISVLGDVMAPGIYEYLPGMTLREALAQAGGTGAAYLSEVSSTRIIEAKGNKAKYEAELREAQLTRKRLLAELDNAEEYDPGTIGAAPADVVEREHEIFDIRNRHRDIVRNHLKEEVTRTEKNLSLLEQNLDLLAQQLEDAQKEAQRRANLRDRGLMVSDAMFEINNYVNDLEIRRLQEREDLRRAERAIETAKKEIATNETSRQMDLNEELKTLDSRIGSLQVAIAQESLLSTGGAIGQGEDGSSESADRFSFTVISQRTGEQEYDVAREQALFPGDTVEVTATGMGPLSN